MSDHRIFNNVCDFYKKLTISSTTFGAPDAYTQDLFIPFSSQGVVIINETPSTAVQISFDGINTHDELSSAIGYSIATYQNRVICKMWFKVTSGSATISVRAWASR